MAIKAGNSPLLIQGANWGIENIVELPINSVLGDPAFVYVNAFSMIILVVVELEKLFVTKKTRSSRKIGEDQHTVFKLLERSLQNTGIEGRACLLRAICEMQQNPFNHYSIMGEILTALLTPKRAAGNLMQEYLEAEKLGQADPEFCIENYSGCPVSLFNMMRTYSTPADKPHIHHHAKDANEEGRFLDAEASDEDPGGIDDGDPRNRTCNFRVDMF